MKKFIKKSIIMLLGALLMLFSGCTRSERADYSELNRRLAKEDKAFCFNENDVFFRDGVYYAFYSVLSDDDMLLTMKENDDGRLTCVSLTSSGNEAAGEESKTVFSRFAAALTRAFVPPENAQELLKAQEEYMPFLFTERFEKAQSGRYTAELFSDPAGVSLILTRGFD